MCKRILNWLLVRGLTARFGLSCWSLASAATHPAESPFVVHSQVHWLFRIVGLGWGDDQEGIAES